jgi:two-component system response regulator
MTDSRPWILWAEDNPKDRMLIQDSVDRLLPPPRLTLVRDGLLLLDALHDSLPDLVVLDLKMPRLGGHETLQRIRTNPAWSAMPVSVFSSGNRPEEVEQCRALGARQIVQKPVDFDQFASAVQGIAGSAPTHTLGPSGSAAPSQ